MDNFLVVRAEKSQYPNLLTFVAPDERGLLKAGTAELLIAVKDVPQEQKEVCGALLYRMDADGFAIRSLYVREEYRRNGAGTQLLKQAQLQAETAGAQKITLTYEVTDAMPEEAAERKLFFMRRGFGMPSVDTTILTIPMESLKDSFLMQLPDVEKKYDLYAMPFDEVPYSAYKDYKSRLGTEIPRILQPSLAPGKVISDMTLAYVYEDQIVAFVVCSHLDGRLHLHAAYVKSQMYAKALICLLKKIWRIAGKKHPAFETLTISAATYQGRMVAEKLLQGAQMIRRTIYSCVKPLVSDAFSVVPPGFAVALARFHTLTDALSNEGISSYLNVIPGEMPVLELPLNEENRLPMAGVRYFVNEFETRTELLLLAQIKLDVKDIPVETLQKRINPICEKGGLTRAYWENEEETVLMLEKERAEEQGLVVEETVEFLSDFLSMIRGLVDDFDIL